MAGIAAVVSFKDLLCCVAQRRRDQRSQARCKGVHDFIVCQLMSQIGAPLVGGRDTSDGFMLIDSSIVEVDVSRDHVWVDQWRISKEGDVCVHCPPNATPVCVSVVFFFSFI
jgi:hypothetical protein